MRVIVLGGAGYIGSVLVPKLLEDGHLVRVVDALWFGNHLKAHPSLNVMQADIREPLNLGGTDAIIHLANVANDPAGDLDPKLTWEVNALATAQLAAQAVRDGVKQFIYASSGSVYGVSDAPQVNEATPLVPLTEYNKTKMVAERVLLSHADHMSVQILRPGTCCGISPRQRLDITVNGLAAQAASMGEINIVGGQQNRPNIHIQDLTNAFIWMLDHPSLTGIWNAGFENLTGSQIAAIIMENITCKVRESQSSDRRSYRMNSDKLLRSGFTPRHTVSDAVREIIQAYQDGKFKMEDSCFNLKTMQRFAVA